MSDALEEHDGKVSIGGRNITNLRFADDIDALAEEEQELEALVESLDKTCTRYKMEISAERTKLMTNSANGIQREIRVKGQKLGTVTSFKYLGAVVSDDGSKPEGGDRVARRCWVNFQCRGVLLFWMIVGQGPIVLAVGAGGGCLDIFSLIYLFTFLSPSLGGGRVVRRYWVNFQCRGVLRTWITVGQGHIVLAVGAGGGCLDIFSLIYQFSFLSPSLWETARYRLKYCLKGPLSTPNQPTNFSLSLGEGPI